MEQVGITRILKLAAAVLSAQAVLAVPAAQATFPGENGRLFFEANTKLANQASYSVNPDGTELRQLATDVIRARRPALSPDSREVAFTGVAPGSNTPGLFRMNVDGGAHTTVLSEAPLKLFWLRDGRIGFVSLLSGRPGFSVETIGRNGEGRQVLFTSSQPSPFLSLSPDDSTFATTEGICTAPPPQGCNVQLKLLNRDGSVRSAVPLPFSSGSEYIRWSPDGQRLALTNHSGVGNNRELFIINADGSGLRRLTVGGDPAWSPDGRQIAFTRFEPGQHLYVINADGSGERLLLGGRWRVFRPSWGSAAAFPPSPSITIAVRKGQRLRKPLRGSASCKLECKLRVRASISIKRANRTFKARSVRLEILANETKPFRLKFSRFANKAIRRLSKGRGRLRVAITATGNDLAGLPVSAQRTMRVRR